MILRGRPDGSQFRGVLQEVLFQLGQNVLAIGVLAQGVAIGPDLVHEDFSLVGLSNIDHLLHHVVGVLILHHGVQWTGSPTMSKSDKRCLSAVNIRVNGVRKKQNKVIVLA